MVKKHGIVFPGINHWFIWNAFRGWEKVDNVTQTVEYLCEYRYPVRLATVAEIKKEQSDARKEILAAWNA